MKTDQEDGTEKLGQHDVRAVFKDNYVAIQYAYIQFLAEHLTDCRKTLGGDLDDMMLLAVLGQRLMSVTMDPAAKAADDEERYWMSALRLSDVTGVPRETVRRKLLKLQEKGWVMGDRTFGWRLAGPPGAIRARLDLSDLDKRGQNRLVRLAETIIRLVSANQTKNSRVADLAELRDVGSSGI